MIRLHECYDRLYYLHSSVYNEEDWYYINILVKLEINNNPTVKMMVKSWLGIKHSNITVTKNRHGIILYGDNPTFPIFFISAVDYTLYYFLLDLNGTSNNMLKSYYYNLFKHIRMLENSTMAIALKQF